MRADWSIKPLGDICHVLGGGTPSKRNTAFYEGDIPWATVRDMRHEVLSSTEFRISEEAIENSATRIIPGGNVIIATRVGLGKICLLDQDTAINQDLRGIIPKAKNLDVKFLFRWLQSVASVIEKEGSGATVKGVKLPFIKSLQIPLPPLPEQKRIVAILDEAFAGIATAIANTEKNLANARELFDSYINNVFSLGPDKWPIVKISDIANVRGGKRVPKGYRLQSEPTPYPYISVADFDDYGSVNVDTVKYISKQVHDQIKRYTICDKDVYISIAGTIGKSGIVPTELSGANLTENACKLELCENLGARFVYLFTRTRSFAEQALKNTRTTAQPKLALSRLKTIRLPLPSKEIQDKIVGEVDELREETRRLERIFQQKLSCLTELKQSLLQKAFSGELTADRTEREVESATA